MKVTGTALKDVKLTSSILLIQCYVDLCKGFIWVRFPPDCPHF